MVVFSRTLVEHYFDSANPSYIVELLLSKNVDNAVDCIISRIKLDAEDGEDQPLREEIISSHDTEKSQVEVYKEARRFLSMHNLFTLEL